MLLYPEKKIKKVTPPKYGKSEERDFENFINFCKKVSDNIDINLFRKAYSFNIEANKNLFRKSGDPFYTHPLEVATFLIDFIMFDNEMIASALLHDVIGKGSVFTIADIESEFGNTIAQIVDNVYRITHLERQDIGNIEYFRRLVLALTTDVRIIFIKIADRFHDMKTISYLSTETQKKFAEDTLLVYVPLAHRFGFYLIKSELEDICFRILDRENYDKIVRKLQMTKKERDEYLKSFAKPIIERLKKFEVLKERGVNFEVHGRVKHIYSIYNKTLLRGKPVEELYDLIGLRLILDTDDETLCEKVIDEIKKIYQYIPETYKDYIKNPKPNGYKSIHCAFIGEKGQKVEVQVRTREMDLVAEKGVAAHYRYKSGLISMDSIFEDPQIEKWVGDIRDILSRKEEVPIEKILESFKYNIFSDEIYVLTPKQEIKILPKGAVVLDFAYSIHTEIGHKCAGAKVNGRTCSLFTPLKNGDVVEIIQGENLQPEPNWFDKVVTSKAKSAILKYFTQSRADFQEKGKQIFEGLLTHYGLTSYRVKVLNHCLKILKYSNSKDFYFELGKVEELKKLVEALVTYLKENNFKFFVRDLAQNNILRKVLEFSERRILVGKKTYEMILSECCLPVRGDDVIAFARNNQIFVHRIECGNSKFEITAPETIKVEFDWNKIGLEEFVLGVKFISDSAESIHFLLSQAFQENKDVLIIHFFNETDIFDKVTYKIFVKTPNNLIYKTMEEIIQSKNLNVKIERIGKS